MALQAIAIDRVVVGDRLRGTSKEQVERLKDSIREVGLINPITVGEETEDGYSLVAGLHRLEACRELGMTEIGAHVVSMPDLQRQLMEVDENLAHTVLTTAQRAIFTAKRKALYLALYPETASVNERGGPGRGKTNEQNSVVSQPQCFAVDTARRTGRNRRTVEIDAQRGATIPHDVLETVSGTDLGRGPTLNIIMRMPVEDQQVLCEHIRAGRMYEAGIMVNNARSLKVVQLPGGCTKEVRNQLARLTNAWALASDEARTRFAKKLDKRGDLKKYGLKLEDIVG